LGVGWIILALYDYGKSMIFFEQMDSFINNYMAHLVATNGLNSKIEKDPSN
jgi:hypothetical protein